MNTKTENPMNWQGFVQPISSQYEALPASAPARTMRAIYHPAYKDCLEFLGDRMADRGDVRPLLRWLKKHSKRIQRHFWRISLPSGSLQWCKYDADGGHFHGTPNSSFGYVYCVAWLDTP